MNDGGQTVADAWTNGELQRAVVELATAVKDLTKAIAELDTKYVRIDVAAERNKAVETRLTDQGEELANLGADLTRFRREISEGTSATWKAWAIPIVTAIPIAVVTALITLLSTHK